MSKNKSAEHYKKQGNSEFAKGDYTRAISLYELSIALNPSNAVYHFNLAESYSKLEMYEEAKEHSARALQLNEKYIKAFILNGRCLVELGKGTAGVDGINEGIRRLEKALSLCSGQDKKDFEAPIVDFLRKAKKIRWFKNHEAIALEGEALCAHLTNLIKQQGLDNESEQIETVRQKLLPKKPQFSDIPPYLLCRLTGKLMKDPVITSVGHTYEREELLNYFKQNGAKDPYTKERIDQNKIFSNRTIKTVIDEYLEKEPWAYEFYESENDYKRVKC